MDDPAVRNALGGPMAGLAFIHRSERLPRPPEFAVVTVTFEVLMNIEHQAGEIRSLTSVSLDAAAGTLEQATAWSGGMETAHLVTRERCEVEQYELPTAATLEAVLTDTIGPLGDPRAEGFSIVSEGLVERDEGPVIQRISSFDRLESRVIEFVSTRDNAVHSSISSIRLTGSTFALRPHLERP